ncbi:MAG: endonuclease [Bacteroidota bacterium]
MRALWCILLIVLTKPVVAQDGTIFSNLRGTELAIALQEAYRPRTVLSYSQARDTLYALIDRRQDSIYCPYTGYAHHLSNRHDPTKYIFDDGADTGMNCEHIWPQSKGTKQGNAKSDMHHLFAVLASVNQARGNHPFGEVDDEKATHWYYRQQNLRRVPTADVRDRYSELGQGYFEPPEDKKGDVARAMFYVYVMYNDQIEVSFLSDQLFTLRYWHVLDPPDQWEIERSQSIGRYQDSKANPFVMDPTLVERIFEE